MNSTEKAILLKFLDDLSDHMSNAGCNDLDLENTPENYELVAAAEKYCAEQNQEKPLPPLFYKDKICTTDFIILSYLVNLIEKNL